MAIVFLLAWACVAILGGLLANTFTAAPPDIIIACAATGFLSGAIAATLFQLARVSSRLDASITQSEKDREEVAKAHTEVAETFKVLTAKIQKLEKNLASQPAPLKAVDSQNPQLPAQLPAATEPLPQQIANAILANRIDLYVQSVHALPSRQPVFYECLSRLRNGQGQTLYPSQFLDYAARSRLMSELDNFLLLRCLQIVRQFGRRTQLERFFLNLAPSSLSDPDFFEQLVDFLEGKADLSRSLILELPAGPMAQLWPSIASGMARLKAKGFVFCLDNASSDDLTPQNAEVGMAYAKISATALLADPDAIARAKASNIALIAARIEDEKTLIDAIELGVPFGQGFVFSKPRAWDDVLVSKGLVAVA